MYENGCIESYRLDMNPIARPMPDRAIAYAIETDRDGQTYLNLYSNRRNGYEKTPERRRVIVVEPVRHSMTERESGSPEIMYIVSFLHSVV